MNSVKSGKKRGFKCDRHALSPDACAGGYISLRKLERIVLAQFFVMSDELLDEEMLEKGIDPYLEPAPLKAGLNSKISMHKKNKATNQAAMKELYVQKLRGQIEEKEYTEKLQSLSIENNDIESEISALSTQLAEVETSVHHFEDKKALITQFRERRTLTKEMVSVLLDYIEVGKKDPATKVTPVVIHWNF